MTSLFQSIVLALVSAAMPCTAAATEVAANDPLRAGAPVDIAALASTRGGFETPTGIRVAFGIERAVYVDGALVTTTRMNVADGGGITAGTSGLANGTTLSLVQSGSNNAFGLGGTSPAGAALVIQNSLDNQKIQAVTLVNATVNSLESTRRTSLQSSIQDALIGSLRR